MVKLGFAFLFAVVFACNCYKKSQAEDPVEKQEDVIVEEEVGSPSAEYDDWFAENNDAVDNVDEPKDESRDETIEEGDNNRDEGFRDDSKKEG